VKKTIGPSHRSGGGVSDLRLRVISALVLGMAILGLTYLGGLAFRALCALGGALILAEWTAMSAGGRGALHRAVLWTGAAGVGLVLLWPLMPLLQLGLLAAAAGAVAAFGTTERGRSDALGLTYAFLPAIALADLRGADTAGLFLVLFLFAIVWATDIAAYFVGLALGGPKLAPSISPGKTWSGAAGGLAGGVAAGVIVALAANVASGTAALLALVLSAVSQIGDLFESAVKRRFGAKDSSRLIPGHGGLMDRVDGLVAAAICLYLLLGLMPDLLDFGGSRG
jgi:phosphatidate cytidylyltransferase